MIKPKRVLSLLGAMLLAGVLSEAAFAGGNPEMTDEYTKALGDVKMMEMMDTNKDHVVTKKEFMTYHEKLFDMMDKTKAGKIKESDWYDSVVSGKRG